MRLIDADALKEVFQNEYKVSFAEAINEVIDEQPTIEPERKMGKWVKAERDGVIVYSDAYAQCSMCKEVAFLGWKMKYCPNCGADMREKTNEQS